MGDPNFRILTFGGSEFWDFCVWRFRIRDFGGFKSDTNEARVFSGGGEQLAETSCLICVLTRLEKLPGWQLRPDKILYKMRLRASL